MFDTLTTGEQILAILAILYLSECAWWLSSAATCFSATWRSYRPLRAISFLQNTHGGIVFVDPWPFAMPFVCEDWPVAISPSTLLLGSRRETTTENPALETPVSLAFDAVQSIVHCNTDVLVNDHQPIRCTSAESARILSAWLQKLASHQHVAREDVIEEMLLQTTDTDAVHARLESLRWETRGLRILSMVFLALVFGVGPLLIYTTFGTMVFWGTYGAGLATCWLLAVRSFAIAHNRLYPQSNGECRTRVVMMLLSPVAATRAPAFLSRNALAGWQPLAVAAVVCRENDFRCLARETLLRFRYDVQVPESMGAQERHGTATDFDTRLLRQLERVVRHAGIDPEELLRLPVPDPDARSYCPRCHGQFVASEGTCRECGDVRLRQFDGRNPDIAAEGGSAVTASTNRC